MTLRRSSHRDIDVPADALYPVRHRLTPSTTMWLKYFDVFPNTPEHLTHFCWLILVTGDPQTFVPNTPGQPPTTGTLTFQYLQHTEGNYASEK
jgi:hypothetical protein